MASASRIWRSVIPTGRRSFGGLRGGALRRWYILTCGRPSIRPSAKAGCGAPPPPLSSRYDSRRRPAGAASYGPPAVLGGENSRNRPQGGGFGGIRLSLSGIETHGRHRSAGPQTRSGPGRYVTPGHEGSASRHTVAGPAGVSLLDVRDDILSPSNIGVRAAARIPIEEFWERARPAQIESVATLVFSHEDPLLHLALHLVYGRGFVGQAKTLCDIGETCRRYADVIDWDHL